MTITNKQWKTVTVALKEMQKQSDAFGKEVSALMIAPESPLVNPLYSMQSALIKTLTDMIDDDSLYLDWWVYECDYGRSPMKAEVDGKMVKIDTLDKLRGVIDAVNGG